MNRNEIDNQLLNDTNLREAVRRRERKRRQMPPELNERLMRQISGMPHDIRPAKALTYRRRWLAVAACLTFIIIGIGAFMLFAGRKAQTAESPVAVNSQDKANKETHRPIKEAQRSNKETQKPDMEAQETMSRMTNAKETASAKTETCGTAQRHQATTAGQAHRVSTATEEDTTRLSPSLVNGFIANFAAIHGSDAIELDCDEPSDSGCTQKVYIFPDEKEVDIFGRMLQTACCYDNATPGYHLYMSQQQLLFELHDKPGGQRYLWLAERLRGSILLYCSQSPIETPAPAACYQKFRDRFAMPHLNKDDYHKF